MWRDIELRELRIFLVLAEELHLGRTAERAGISQPGVSEAMRVLESRLGVKVFDRTSRRVRLTPAGEALRYGLVPALAAVDQALAETSELSRAVRGLLRTGFVLTTEGPALSRLSAAFQARCPGCEVRLQEVETFDAYRGLRRGDIDILCNWLAVDEPDLTAGAVFACYQRALAVATSHRLAGRSAVSAEDLAGEEVAVLPASTPAAVYDLLVRAHAIGATDPPHSARPDHQRDPLAGGPRAHRPPRPARPFPYSTATTSSSSPSPGCPPAARAGLVHRPGEPAHPRPQRSRERDDRGTGLTRRTHRPSLVAG